MNSSVAAEIDAPLFTRTVECYQNLNTMWDVGWDADVLRIIRISFSESRNTGQGDKVMRLPLVHAAEDYAPENAQCTDSPPAAARLVRFFRPPADWYIGS